MPKKKVVKKTTVKTPKKNIKTKKIDVKKENNGILFRGILAFLALFIIATFFFDDSGWFGQFVSSNLKGLFGAGIFIIPLYFILIVFFWKRNRDSNKNTFMYIICFANWISFSIIIQLLTTTADERSFTQAGNWIVVFFENGKNIVGSGLLGGIIGSISEPFMGFELIMIISSLLFFFSIIFLFGTTPVALYKNIKNFFSEISIPFDNDNETDEPAKSQPVASTTVADKKPEKTVDIPIEIPTQPIVDIPINDEDDYKSIFKEDEKTIKPVLPIDDIYDNQANLDIKNNSNENFDIDVDIARSPIESHSDIPYVFPPLSLLTEGEATATGATPAEILKTSEKLVSTLASFGVLTRIINTSCGPTVTRYELAPESGVKVKSIANLSDDIALHLAATSIRIESPIPGKSAVGIELPNKNSTIVRLRDLISNSIFRDAKQKLFVCLGVDVAGNPIYFDIGRMPHLLIAGATGMGKSVCINSIIISLLYKARPDEVKLILIDPKKIEFSDYTGIPHLLVPVVTDPKKAAGTLAWAINEMEKRFTLFAEVAARDLSEYNESVKNDPEREYTPHVVIIIDELADLMMTAPQEVETAICRLAQKARAAGMHLVLGTQRPSVDVITGLIKANIPSRIACTVASQIDSRTILDIAGAEKLMGRGDMLFSPVGSMKPLRVQGSYVDGKTEVTAVCAFIKKQYDGVSYDDEIQKQIEENAKLCGEKGSKRAVESNDSGDIKEDAKFLEAIETAIESGTVSTSMLQTRLALGYARAARIVDTMERRGYIGAFDPATKKRPVYITMQQLMEMKINKND